jgi:outer membrane lipopolysaccharide assembly protein LptE/RlpB
VDRPIAFGIDGQNNRVVIQLTLVYQITNVTGHDLICPTTIQVERELNVNPNAVLGTQSERDRVLLDLYHDVTAQIMRNLTPPCE